MRSQQEAVFPLEDYVAHRRCTGKCEDDGPATIMVTTNNIMLFLDGFDKSWAIPLSLTYAEADAVDPDAEFLVPQAALHYLLHSLEDSARVWLEEVLIGLSCR